MQKTSLSSWQTLLLWHRNIIIIGSMKIYTIYFLLFLLLVGGTSCDIGKDEPYPNFHGITLHIQIADTAGHDLIDSLRTIGRETTQAELQVVLEKEGRIEENRTFHQVSLEEGEPGYISVSQDINFGEVEAGLSGFAWPQSPSFCFRKLGGGGYGVLSEGNLFYGYYGGRKAFSNRGDRDPCPSFNLRRLASGTPLSTIPIKSFISAAPHSRQYFLPLPTSSTILFVYERFPPHHPALRAALQEVYGSECGVQHPFGHSQSLFFRTDYPYLKYPLQD